MYSILGIAAESPVNNDNDSAWDKHEGAVAMPVLNTNIKLLADFHALTRLSSYESMNVYLELNCIPGTIVYSAHQTQVKENVTKRCYYTFSS